MYNMHSGILHLNGIGASLRGRHVLLASPTVHDTAGSPTHGRRGEMTLHGLSLVAHDAHRLIRSLNPPNLLRSQLKLATPDEIVELLETRRSHDRSRDEWFGKTPCESDLRHGDVSGFSNGLDGGDDGFGWGGEGWGVVFPAIGGDFGVDRAAEDCEGRARSRRGQGEKRQLVCRWRSA